MSTARRRLVVPAADSVPSAQTLYVETNAAPDIEPPSPDTSEPTQISDEDGYEITSKESDYEYQSYRNSVVPSRPSTKHWRTPVNVREFASQANEVASMVLNGEMDVNVARIYSGLARTVAQAMSTEVSRARFLSQLPDLSFMETNDADE